MSRKEAISMWRKELISQYSRKTGESPIDPAESVFSDELVAFAIELDLCMA